MPGFQILSGNSIVLFNFCDLPDSKVDGVGPVDNRPFTDKLQHFVKKKKK